MSLAYFFSFSGSVCRIAEISLDHCGALAYKSSPGPALWRRIVRADPRLDFGFDSAVHRILPALGLN